MIKKPAKIKEHMEIVLTKEEDTIDAIPLATKPPTIVTRRFIKKKGKLLLITELIEVKDVLNLQSYAQKDFG
ncbi:hypothetical protein Tco_0587669 [Tanacetum coccineum]